MFNALSTLEVRNAQCAVEQNGPDFLFFKNTIFLVSNDNLISETVVNELKNEDYLIKGRTEGVVYLGVGFLKIQNIIVFGSEFSAELEEGLLEGFFGGICVLLDEVHGTGGRLLVDFSDW